MTKIRERDDFAGTPKIGRFAAVLSSRYFALVISMLSLYVVSGFLAPLGIL